MVSLKTGNAVQADLCRKNGAERLRPLCFFSVLDECAH